MKSIILENGVVLQLSDRKNNTAGYTGVTFSPVWTLNEFKPFIAMTSNPSDPVLVKELTATKRNSLHLGHYNDAREAAYVIGLYNKNPLNTIITFNKHGNFTDFPAYLYEQEPGMTLAHAKTLIPQSTNKVKAIDRNIPATNNLIYHFNMEDVKQIARILGNSNDFQEYIVGMTIEDFKNDFELEYK